MSRLRKAARATAVVHAFNLTAMVLSLVTVPLYLQWLGQERYGVLLTGLAFGGYLMFSDAGLSWSSMLLISEAAGRDDRAAISRIVRSSFLLAACSAVLVALIAIIVVFMLRATKHFAWLPQHPEAAGLLLAVASSVACTLALSPFYNLFVGLQEAHIGALYQGTGRIAGTIAGLAVASTGASLGFVFGANVLCAFASGLAAAFHCARRHGWAFVGGSLYDSGLLRKQLRTGAKSFAMQLGGVIAATAPVLAISSAAGPQFVPYLSIPLTLLNAPLGVTNSFSAILQPGYGEAIGRNETMWVGETVRRILRHVLLTIGLLACGFLLLAGPFVQHWTGGRITLQPVMLLSALAIAAIGAVFGVFRCALTGMNRHRIAGAGELAFGILSMVLAVFIVRRFGFEWVGAGVLCASLLTSAWILPRELRLTLSTSSLWPSREFGLRWAAIVCAAAGSGWVISRFAAAFPSWLALCVTGCSICVVYLTTINLLLPKEWNSVRTTLGGLMPGRLQSALR